MEVKHSNSNKAIIVATIIFSIVLIGVLSSYAFFTITASSQNEKVNVQTGTLALTFADGNDAITESLEFGGSVEKTFTIENTGTLDAWAKINFEDLVNTYLDGSLTFTLSYSESENDEYTDLITNKNISRSETSSTKEIVDSLSIPAGAKYFYKLKITLNYLDEVDQTDDLKAIFSTYFKLEQGSAKYTITFIDGNGENTTKDVLENATYGELPTPTKDGYVFMGWFTEPNGKGAEITSTTTVNLNSSQTLYAHFKEKVTFAKSLITKANGTNITSYTSGNRGEMYTFSHPATSQTPALTDYRYIGSSPNNYITFNDETWRIIGVFSVENEKGEYEQRIKIMREKSLEAFPWDSKSDKTYKNEWPTSSLGTMLNNDYVNKNGTFNYVWYNSSGTGTTVTIRGLNSIAKNQIAPVKWYLGAINNSSAGATDYYNYERGTATCATASSPCSGGRSTNTVANVGLMYPSDYSYTYANGVDSTCFQKGTDCRTTSSGVPSNGWIYMSLSTSGEWFLTPSISSANYALFHDKTGYITTSIVRINTRESRPCVYLRPDIEITSGDGTTSKPYILKAPTN